MMNIIQLQDQLKNFSQEQLVKEMQMPSGNTPQYLVLGEIMRRKQMESSAAGQQAPQETVAQEAVAAAGVPQGGIADMARALAPKTDMAQNTGVQAMARGGPVKKMNVGGAVMTDEAVRIMANRAGMSIAEYLKSVGPERAAAITTDAARRAASQTTGLANVFNESIPVRGTQTGSDEFHSKFGRLQDEALLELGVNPTRSFGGDDYYAQDLPTPLTAEETFRQENPFSYPVSATPTSDFRATPERPSIFEEIGGTVGEIAQNYRNAQLRANRQEALGQGSEDRPLTAAEQAIADRRGEIFGGIRDLAGRAGQAIDDNLLGPAGAFLTEGRGLAQDAKALAATLIPGFEGAAISAKEQAELARQEAERLRQGGFFPNESGDPSVAKEAGAAKRSSDAYKQMADTMKEAGIANLAGDKLAPAAALTAPTAPTAAPAPTAPTAPTAPQGGGISNVSPFEQQLMDALASREKAATQDKWLALAQVGLNLMSSTNPTPLGALGEAGLKGVEAARAARDQYDKDKLDLQGAIEQSRMARAAASARAASGATAASGIGGLKLKDYLGQLEKTGTVARSTLELLTGGLPPESAMAAAEAAGDLSKQSRIKTAYDAALKADQDFQNAVRQISGLPLSAEADDDTNIDATE